MPTMQYRFVMIGRCPVDNSIDSYDVLVESPTTIMAELILQFLGHTIDKPATQERLTEALRHFLGGQCRVTSTGMHSGIHTTVTI